MDVKTVFEQARDATTVKRVFGDPYEKNGLTVIPVAKVMGGAGGGEGEGAEGAGHGSGGGFGVAARPAGMYVIQGEEVRWMPALDLNRLLLGMQILAVVALIMGRSVARARIEHA